MVVSSSCAFCCVFFKPCDASCVLWFVLIETNGLLHNRFLCIVIVMTIIMIIIAIMINVMIVIVVVIPIILVLMII